MLPVADDPFPNDYQVPWNKSGYETPEIWNALEICIQEPYWESKQNPDQYLSDSLQAIAKKVKYEHKSNYPFEEKALLQLLSGIRFSYAYREMDSSILSDCSSAVTLYTELDLKLIPTIKIGYWWGMALSPESLWWLSLVVLLCCLFFDAISLVPLLCCVLCYIFLACISVLKYWGDNCQRRYLQGCSLMLGLMNEGNEVGEAISSWCMCHRKNYRLVMGIVLLDCVHYSRSLGISIPISRSLALPSLVMAWLCNLPYHTVCYTGGGQVFDG